MGWTEVALGVIAGLITAAIVECIRRYATIRRWIIHTWRHWYWGTKRVRYRGRSETLRLPAPDYGRHDIVIKKGQIVDLRPDIIERLMQQGHLFEEVE